MTTKPTARVNLICPVPGCKRKRKPNQVMCRDHWYQVPAAIQARVWNGYFADRGGADHLAAIRDAIESVNT